MGGVKHLTTERGAATLIRYSSNFARVWYREADDLCKVAKLYSPMAIALVAAQMERDR